MLEHPGPELLAPAGDWSALEAALDAGANAVYLGLTTLNARRKAKNFTLEEFTRAVRTAHERGVRVYLTLNVDVAERELPQAAGILQWAQEAAVDAVLVRDPGMLALRAEFPGVEFHFSTQTCMANSADVAAAQKLGASRVVLARELSLEEIAAASAVPGVQTEVFIQGALCFCVSGRCLLSSWVGGRSGNRGACTSPCRVPWSVGGHAAGTPLSMHDLSTLHRLDDLRRAGVTALKIEGRLKTAAWVGKAVGLYRRALAGEGLPELDPQAAGLGNYTGRQLTCGYLDADREHLTGQSGRQSVGEEMGAGILGQEADDTRSVSATEEADDTRSVSATGEADDTRSVSATAEDFSYDLEILLEGKGIACHCKCQGVDEAWSMPKTVVRRQNKAISVGQLMEFLEANPVQGCQLGLGQTDEPDFLMMPRASNALIERVTKVVSQARKATKAAMKVELRPEVERLLDSGTPSTANRHRLGEPPNRARLDADAVAAFLRQVHPEAILVEGVTAENFKTVRAACGRTPWVAALPPVFFEPDLPGLRALVGLCAGAKVPVEVNSWGGWLLAKEARAKIEAGPGLPVLNSLAARTLQRAGMEPVTLSPEADRRQLEEASSRSPAACSLVVFGRPALLTSRVELPPEVVSETLEDRRGVRMTARRENSLWVFRPVVPYDLRGLENDRIHVRHLVVDLVGSPNPVEEWQHSTGRSGRTTHFNYDRTLA